MKVRIRPLTITTVVAWCIAVALSPASQQIVPQSLAFSFLGLCILLTWMNGRPRPELGDPSPGWFWALYLVLVTAGSAWYIHARGTMLTVELLLPTTAVLLVLAPIRTIWLEHNHARRPECRDALRTDANARDDEQD